MYHGERFNGYAHLAGAVMALGAASVLVALGAQRGDPYRIVISSSSIDFRISPSIQTSFAASLLSIVPPLASL